MDVRSLASNFAIANSPKANIKCGGWTKPIKGHVKLNVDASFDPDSFQGAVGAVLRDDKGNFIAEANEEIDICTNGTSPSLLD